MKRATITISDKLEPALAAYLKDQEITPNLTRLFQTALEEFLSVRGYSGSKKGMRVPAPRVTTTIQNLTPKPRVTKVVRSALMSETDTTLL